MLVTDFDGTLAPIVADPDTAAALPESLQALAELASLGLKVVVLSARPTLFLEAKISLPGLQLLGDNGLEMASVAEITALKRFNALARDLVKDRPGLRLESTPASTSVHFRAAPEIGGGLFEDVSSLASSLHLVASRGRMVVEVRPRRGTKVRALGALIKSLKPTSVIFAGDDEGDRSAFELLSRFDGAHLAIGILSDETASDLFTFCDLVLDGPADLAAFLVEWMDRLGASL